MQVFSAFGPVQKIAMFDKNGGLQALIQFPGRVACGTYIHFAEIVCLWCLI